MWPLLLVGWLAIVAQQLPRDAPPPSQHAPASIAGRVIDDTGRPVPAAAVVATTAGAPGARTALTDGDGRFTLDGVPPGRVTLAAKRPGFPRVEFGQLNPFGAGTIIVVKPGERFDASLTMPRGAVITGRVFDDAGDPLPGGSVAIFRWSEDQGDRRTVYVAGATADGRGMYRAFGLPAGEFVVASGWGARPSIAPPESITVSVAAGEERHADIRTPAIPAASGRLSGTVLLNGAPVRFTNIQLLSDSNRNPVTVTTDTGTFLVRALAPGAYTLVARATAGREPFWGIADVRVEPNESTDAAIALKAGTTLSGTIAVDVAGDPDPGRLSISLVPTELPEHALSSYFRIDRNGPSFTISGIPPGTYTIRLNGPAELAEWSAKAMLKDVDLIERPVAIGDQPVAGVVVSVSDRTAMIQGRVADATGAAAGHTAVVIFSADRRDWHAGSRRVAMARPDTEGAFTIRGLPPGTYHAALTTRLPAAWQHAAFLERLARAATITLREGDRLPLDLVIRR